MCPDCAHNGNVRENRIRRGRRVAARALAFCAVTLAVVAAAPVIVLAGEPLRRYAERRLSWPQRRTAQVVIANPVFIALTAPERWAIDQASRLSAGGSGGGSGRFGRRGGGPPPAGVREPRRPKPAAPAGAIALAEPQQQLRVVPILKALPAALSRPVRRIGSLLRSVAAVMRLRSRPGL